MNILRVIEKTFIRLSLIVIFFLLQSCSNTLIGEKLENSFDLTEDQKTLKKTNQKSLKPIEIKKIKSIAKDDKKENKNDFGDINKETLLSNRDKISQKSTKSIKKTIFNPQPYRIILKLSGANPAAPAETVTEALRKAGVQFEVEKIERFDEENLSKNTILKR